MVPPWELGSLVLYSVVQRVSDCLGLLQRILCVVVAMIERYREQLNKTYRNTAWTCFTGGSEVEDCSLGVGAAAGRFFNSLL